MRRRLQYQAESLSSSQHSMGRTTALIIQLTVPATLKQLRSGSYINKFLNHLPTFFLGITRDPAHLTPYSVQMDQFRATFCNKRSIPPREPITNLLSQLLLGGMPP